MTKRFSKVSPAVWRSRRFTGLPDSDAKLLYLYFVTSEHQTSIGAYMIPPGYAVADLGWDVKIYDKARTALVKAELIAFDADNSTVYVLRWFKHSPPMNASHAEGCLRQIGDLESVIIAERVLADFTAADGRRIAGTSPAAPDPIPLRAQTGAERWPVRTGANR